MDPLNNIPQQNNDFIKKWSWSAFFGTWVFLFANKQHKLGVKFLLLFLLISFLSYAPWLGIMNFTTVGSYGSSLQILFFGCAVWLGVRGKEIVWNSGVWHTQEEFLQKQKFIRKLVVLYFIASVVVFTVSLIVVIKPYLDNPDLMTNRAMSESLIMAQGENPNINKTEFETGYKFGSSEGLDIEIRKSNVTDQTSSYQIGYRYGYILSCMSKHDRNICYKKALE